MKYFLIISLAIFGFSTCHGVQVEEKFSFQAQQKNLSTFVESARISSGFDGKMGENLELCWMNVTFQHKWQLCGCTLVHPEWVVTSLLCVYDFVESYATYITIVFPQAKMKQKMNSKRKIVINEDGDNIAMVKLEKPLIVDDKTVRLATFATQMVKDVYVNQEVRACGIGTIKNFPTFPGKLKCVDLLVVPIDKCDGLKDKTFCTSQGNNDKNICNNDYGGPIYKNTYNKLGKAVTQEVVGISAYFPDYRPNAACQDGHQVIHLQVAYYIQWWNNVIASN